MDSFALRLIAPYGVIFEGQVEQVTATSPVGEFGVLAQHVDFLSALVACPLVVKLPGTGYRYYAVPSGLAEVKNGKMTILVPQATPAEEIDVEQAGAEVDDLRQKLHSLEPGGEEHAEVERALALAQARWRAAQSITPRV
jgi:F-type H+-transporting ATPase subunit epsilon